jgi:rhodanese-related sulfurtransferase
MKLTEIFAGIKTPTEINREEVLTMAAVGAQLVEALPARQYEEERLPSAISIPLKKLDNRTAATLDRNKPVIVYCYDYQ